MEFRVLGPLEAIDGDGSLQLGGPKQRTLLAHLLLRSGEVVTVDRLVDALWGEEPPESARNTIQTYVSHLRKVLGADRIQHQSGGYLLTATDDEVDLARFQAKIAEARTAAAVRPSNALELLGEALEMWRGPAIDDLADQPSLQSDIARLEELRMIATEDRIAAELSMGRHRELVSELETLVGRYPYRERLWAHLMTALYRSGRQADGLTAYQRARSLLADELGIDPSPDLQRLHEQILQQDTALDISGEPLRGYRLLEQIGAGWFGSVHRAYQPQVGREVAVKVIHPRFANDPDFIRRFEAEAQLVARLEHPAVVPLYDFWREPDGAYLVMRYLRGGSLRQRLNAGPLTLDDTIRLLEQLAPALDVAHRQGIVHRDVKPANILFDEDGNAYLSDFGIAKDIAASDGVQSSSPDASYLTPEEVVGEEVTPRTDVYSLGLVLLEALTGRHPFEHAIPSGVATSEPPVAAIGTGVPEAIADVIRRATTKRPVDRYHDVPSFVAAFLTAAARRPAPMAAVVAADAANPFKGLRPFTEADALDFFGREALIERLLSRLREPEPTSRFLAVVGPSGSGKSSVVRAGLVPALRGGALLGSDGWFIVEMHPGTHPFEELAAALVRVAVDPGPDLAEQLERDGLGRVAEDVVPDGAELLVVIDQFEELFTLVADEETRVRFLDTLHAAAGSSKVRVIVTLRGDFYDRPLLYAPFGELLAERTEAVTPPSVEELERAVSGPAARAGLTAEAALLAEIVAEVSSQPGALPLFQYALTELFERRSEGKLTLEAYREIGGVTGALARRAEELYDRLSDSGKEAARQLFLRLVAVGEEGSADTRRRLLRSELSALEVQTEAMEGVIDTFGARRLLSFDRDPISRGPTVEVAHEALLREWGRLRGWVEGAREQLLAHGRLAAAAKEWVGSERDDGFLARGAPLTRFEALASSTGLAFSADERAYLDASIAQRDAERAADEARAEREAALERRSLTRMRALVAALTAAAFLASGLTFVAIGQRSTAQRQSRIAISRELAAAANANLDVDPERSILLALHALEMTAGDDVALTEAVQALHDGIAADRLLLTLRHPSTANAKWSPDGRFLATGGTAAGRAQHVALIWDAETGALLHTLRGHTSDIGELTFSPDSSLLVTHGDSEAEDPMIIWDTATGRRLKSTPTYGWGSSFSPDGRELVVSTHEGPVVLDPRSGRTLRRFPHLTGCAPPTFSPNGRTIAFGAGDEVRIIDAASGRLVRALPGGACGVVFSPEGKRLATSRLDPGLARIWDIESGKVLFSLPGSDPIGLDWSADGLTIATGENDGTARIWDSATGEPLLELRGHSGAVALVGFSPDGTRLLTGGTDGTARLWDLTGPGTVEEFGVDEHVERVGVSYSQDGTLLVSGGWDRGWVRETANGRVIRGVRAVTGVGMATRTPKMVYLKFIDEEHPLSLTIHDLPSGRERVVADVHDWPPTPAISADGRKAAIGGFNVQVWNADDPDDVKELSTDDHTKAVALSPDGRLVAGLTGHATLFVWDLASGDLVFKVQAQSGFGAALTFSQDGSRLATAGADGASIWSGSGERLMSFTGGGRLESVAFSADGSLLASGGADGTARLWDASTGEQLLVLRGHTGPVRGVGFSPDGTNLASAGVDGTVRVSTLLVGEAIEIARGRLTRDLTAEECRRYLHRPDCASLGLDLPEPEPRVRTAIGPEGSFRATVAEKEVFAGSAGSGEPWWHVGDYTISLHGGRYEIRQARPIDRSDPLAVNGLTGTYSVVGDRITMVEQIGDDVLCFGMKTSARWRLGTDGLLRFTDIRAEGPEGCNIAFETSSARFIFGSRPWSRVI